MRVGSIYLCRRGEGYVTMRVKLMFLDEWVDN